MHSMNYSEDALALIYGQYWKYCYKIAYGILKNHWDTEECVNDVFFLLWQQPKEPKNLPAFLGAAARNRAISMLRQKCAVKRGGGVEDAVVDENRFWGRTDLEDSICVRICIDQVLSGYTLEDRRLFLRRYEAGDSIRDLSQRFDLSENCVKVRLMRMRNRLKQELSIDGL